MPVRRNRYYLDQQNLTQGFSNLAKIFAPPSATEIYAYAKAGQANDDRRRQQEGFDALASQLSPEQLARAKATGDFGKYMQVAPGYDLAVRAAQPGVDPASLDSGVYAVHGNFNNTAEGQRRANAAEMQRTLVQEQGQTTRTLLQPVGKDATRFNTPGVAQHFGVAPIQSGIVAAQQGETNVLPDGRVISGAPKPLTKAEVEGNILSQMPTDQQRAIVYGNTPLVDVIMDGNRVKVPGIDAAGKTPAPPIPTGQPKTGNFLVNGAVVPGRLSENGPWVNAQTNDPLPPNAAQIELQGTPGDVGLGQGTKGTIDRQLLSIASAANTVDRYRQMIQANPGTQGMVGALQGTVQNLMQTGGEMAELFGGSRSQIDQMIAQNRFAPEVAARFRNFRADIPAAEALRQMLIAQVAAATTDDPQVSNKDIERVEKQVGGGSLLSNQADTLARLGQVTQDLQARRELLSRAGTAGATVFGGAAPTPAAPATGTQPQQRRLRYNPATGQLE